jgi:hypothetical protein
VTDPIEALDQQVRTQQFWKSSVGQLFGDGFIESAMPSASLNLARHQYHVCGVAETFVLTADMSLSCESASQLLPPEACAHMQLPMCDTGFLYMDRPLKVVDVHGVPLPIRTITWNKQQVTVTSPDNDDKHMEDIILICCYADNDDLMDGSRGPMSPDKIALIRAQPPLLVSVFPIFPNKPTDEILTRFLIAFWSMINQRIVGITRKHAPRAQLRQLARHSFANTEVTVIDLRLKYYDDAPREPNDHDPTLSFNWKWRTPVVAHYRRQYYPSRGTPRHPDGSWNEESHAWILIEETFRGPEDAPIRQVDRVFRVKQ